MWITDLLNFISLLSSPDPVHMYYNYSSSVQLKIWGIPGSRTGGIGAIIKTTLKSRLMQIYLADSIIHFCCKCYVSFTIFWIKWRMRLKSQFLKACKSDKTSDLCSIRECHSVYSKRSLQNMVPCLSFAD